MADDATKISSGIFKTMLGLDATKHPNPDARPENVSFMNRFSKLELQRYLNHIYTRPEDAKAEPQAAGIIPYLTPVHRAVGNKRVQAEKMQALAPEIEQSRILVSSSIMSPNYLQDGEFIFTLDNVPGVGTDPELAHAIAEVYSEMYNKNLSLGIKSYDWIGEIQYSSGCKPVLILPIATHMALHDRTAEDVQKEQNDVNRLYDFGPNPNMANRNPYSGCASFEDYSSQHKADDDYFYSNKVCTWKQVLSQGTVANDLAAMEPSMESYQVVSPFKAAQRSNIMGYDNDYTDPEYLRGLESMIVNLRTTLEEGDLIKVSENPEILRFGTTKKLTDKEAVLNKLHAKYNVDDNPVIEDIVELEATPKNYAHMGHPSIIELPPESVIPIFIPGAPSEHLGYFIMLDEHGQPLTVEASGELDNSYGCKAGDPSSAYEAVFGSSCCNNRFFSNQNTITHAGRMMFEYFVDKYLKTRIQGIFGRNDLTLSRFNAISTMMFYRLLDRKRTTLIYCPPELLHYFAFDYDRSTGVGKAKIEELQFLLSLRATYQIANVIAAANDAIDHKTVTVGMDDKNANLEAVLDMVAQIFIAKHKVTGSIDPSEILRDLYSNSLTIVPESVPGLSNLKVDVQQTNGQSSRVDDNLVEQLTNLIVSHLDVPPAALNQLTEPEYAKSLVTYNLFFAKKIARYQRMWCAMMTEFIRVHSSFDIPFQQAILKKLEAHGRKVNPELLPKDVRRLARRNPNMYSRSSYGKTLRDILDNVEVKLAKPNIAVDTAQFEQIRTFLGNLDEMANQFFNRDLIESDDSAATSALPVMAALWKRKQLATFLDNIGAFNMVELPDVDEFDDRELMDFIQTLQNLHIHMSKQRKTIADPVNNSVETGSDTYDSGGDDGGFGDDFGGGDEDSGFGGGDMDLGESSSEAAPDKPIKPEDIPNAMGGIDADAGEGEGDAEGANPAAEMYYKFKKK